MYENLPPITPPTFQESPKKNTRLIILIVIMILVGILAIGYFWYQNRQTPLPTQTQNLTVATSTDQFADWKTYTNTEYEFEFKYPTNWQDKEVQNGSWDFQSTDFSNNVHGIGIPPIGDMWVEIMQGNCNSSSTDFVNESAPEEPDISEKTVCSNNFQITLGLWNKDSDFTNHKELLNQILSTFKFISTSTPTVIDTSNWETFSNAKYGYEFRYPKDWSAFQSVYNETYVLFGPGATDKGGSGGVEYIGDLKSGQSLQNFIEEFNQGVGGGSSSETPSTVNGQGVVISIMPIPSLEEDGRTESKAVAFSNNGKVFEVYLNYYTDFTKHPADKINLDNFNQLLSTFKFTGQNQTGCNTDSDCQNGASCMVTGPIIVNQPVHKVCVPKGQAVPL